MLKNTDTLNYNGNIFFIAFCSNVGGKLKVGTLVMQFSMPIIYVYLLQTWRGWGSKPVMHYLYFVLKKITFTYYLPSS